MQCHAGTGDGNAEVCKVVPVHGELLPQKIGSQAAAEANAGRGVEAFHIIGNLFTSI